MVKNAIKFTPSNGEVKVITSDSAPGRLRIEVVDTGIGIDESGLQRIFNAFEQGSVSTQQFGGLGLGLAIARAIVDMHRGSIAAASAGKDRGSTFTIEFDTCAAPPAPASPVPSPKAARGRQLRLLLVEDHDSSREVLASILRRFGHFVEAAANGADALRAAASAEPLDLVISDLGLPDQSGFELMEKLKARHGLRGIALSGYGMDEDVRRAREAGFSAHLIKPVSMEQLRLLLDQAAAGTLS